MAYFGTHYPTQLNQKAWHTTDVTNGLEAKERYGDEFFFWCSWCEENFWSILCMYCSTAEKARKKEQFTGETDSWRAELTIRRDEDAGVPSLWLCRSPAIQWRYIPIMAIRNLESYWYKTQRRSGRNCWDPCQHRRGHPKSSIKTQKEGSGFAVILFVQYNQGALLKIWTDHDVQQRILNLRKATGILGKIVYPTVWAAVWCSKKLRGRDFGGRWP